MPRRTLGCRDTKKGTAKALEHPRILENRNELSIICAFA